ncbi:hypothetical protein BY996DRAFT_6442773 [Phakopsora pachyrhizi]|nr:hypothetical protein BY996DRAFT_6442773 [Phakopsora pachyrhizi]
MVGNLIELSFDKRWENQIGAKSIRDNKTVIGGYQLNGKSKEIKLFDRKLFKPLERKWGKALYQARDRVDAKSIRSDRRVILVINKIKASGRGISFEQEGFELTQNQARDRVDAISI